VIPIEAVVARFTCKNDGFDRPKLGAIARSVE